MQLGGKKNDTHLGAYTKCRQISQCIDCRRHHAGEGLYTQLLWTRSCWRGTLYTSAVHGSSDCICICGGQSEGLYKQLLWTWRGTVYAEFWLQIALIQLAHLPKGASTRPVYASTVNWTRY